jgi:hypothetical protein
MCISVLISRDAHQNGLEANAALRGKPPCFLGANAPGCVFLVTSFAQAKEVTRQQAKKGFSEPENNAVNNLTRIYAFPCKAWEQELLSGRF